MDLTALAAEIGVIAPVTIAGRSTRGGARRDVRCVVAPAGIGTFLPDEMTVSCGAGTPIDELQAALAERGQFVTLPEGGTVGGALAVGRAGPLRLGHGPVRDTLLQCHVVLADGAVVMAGGPTVKNVSGFDLCRLFVGAQGTLGFFGSVLLRTRPRPAERAWFSSPGDPGPVRRRLFRPAAILWDGTTTWVCLEGHPADVAEQATGAGLARVDGPPSLPAGGRLKLSPSDLWRSERSPSDPWRSDLSPSDVSPAELPRLDRAAWGPFVAEIGVGVVHTTAAVDASGSVTDPAVVALSARIKRLFDPSGRMNPGRAPLGLDADALAAGAPS